MFSHLGALVRRDWVRLPEGKVGVGGLSEALTRRLTHYLNKSGELALLFWTMCAPKKERYHHRRPS